MLTLKNCVGVFSGIFKARILKLGIHMDNELYCGIEIWTPCSYSSLYLSIFYPFFFAFVFRLLRICVTVFFATYLLLHIHIVFCSALLKQCSGAIVRFSDSSSFALEVQIILWSLTSLSHSLIDSNYQVCLNDKFDLWHIYSDERFRDSWPSCSHFHLLSLKGPDKNCSRHFNFFTFIFWRE